MIFYNALSTHSLFPGKDRPALYSKFLLLRSLVMQVWNNMRVKKQWQCFHF